ncbi:hypothetical protein P7K49_009169 [Saguinus oedipus]|uniref:Uncharacterized protein n=1 Tax=Saguinus oedipus TaxID=9490 RepID=A0ABQ9VJ74_SAGOE|nr:hypothetical protein P7K49_009169 [Saguinus oedipus]
MRYAGRSHRFSSPWYTPVFLADKQHSAGRGWWPAHAEAPRTAGSSSLQALQLKGKNLSHHKELNEPTDPLSWDPPVRLAAPARLRRCRLPPGSFRSQRVPAPLCTCARSLRPGPHVPLQLREAVGACRRARKLKPKQADARSVRVGPQTRGSAAAGPGPGPPLRPALHCTPSPRGSPPPCGPPSPGPEKKGWDRGWLREGAREEWVVAEGRSRGGAGGDS